MSGVFFNASHATLQYLPDVVMHEQMGCAHFPPFAVVISFLLAPGQQRVIQCRILNGSKKRFCSIRNTFQFWFAEWRTPDMDDRTQYSAIGAARIRSNDTTRHPETGDRRPSTPESVRNS